MKKKFLTGPILLPIILSTDDEETKKAKGLLNETKAEAVKDALTESEKKAKEIAEGLVKEAKELVQKESKEAVSELEKKLNDFAAEVKASQKTNNNEEEVKSIAVQLKEAIEAKKDDFEAMKQKKSPFEFEIKAAGSMMLGTNLSGTTAQAYLPAATVMPGVISIARNKPVFMDAFDTQTTNTPRLVWINESNPDGDAAFTAEGGLKSLADFDLTAEESTAKKPTIRFKVSEEMLDDIPFIEAEIRNKGLVRLRLKIDGGLLSGDGVSPNLKGITGYAPGFTITSLNATVNNANNYDAIKAAIVQIVNASDEWYPNVLFINPIDKFAMEHTKSTQDEYTILKLQMANGQLFNLRVIETNQIPAGSFLLGDSTKAHIRIYKGISVKMGWDSDDFSKNMRTVIMEARLHFYVSDNEKTAFVYEDYATIKTALETA